MDTNTENTETLVAKSIRFDSTLHAAISQLADEEDRPSFNNMVERLLKTHPRVKKLIEAETAGASA
jgi:hypothetical protein